jgi:hypothetical protein
MAKNYVIYDHQTTPKARYSHNFSAFVGTWNVHGSLPTSSLKDWLQDTLKADDGRAVDPDFYVIG